MAVPRRRVLQASGLALTGLAGCSNPLGDGGDSTDGATSDGDAGDRGGEPDGSEGPLELEFGAGAEFTNDDGLALQMLLEEPRLVETVPVVRDGQIYVDSPESTPYFLFVTVQIVNAGSSAIEPPKGLYFEADGEAVDRAFIRTPGPKYREIGELSPGDGATATIAFPAPDGAGTGTVSLRFQTLLESPPARWTFDFADVLRESTDLTREGLGDTFAIETGGYAYEFTPTAARETNAYTADDGSEHTPSAGSTFVLVDALAENVAEEPVNLPNPYDVRLAADGSVSRGTRYEVASERYNGRVDPYPPGARQEGAFLFEVPDSASKLTFRLAIGNQTYVTWPLELSDG